MMKYFIGIDSGSTMCKSVLFDAENKNIVDYYIIKTSWNPKLSAKESLELLLNRNNLSDKDIFVCATGYGREAIDFSDCTFTEITCHGLGAAFLAPHVGGVVDIGGQDSKVILLRNNKVADFLMNDKCAAGTGRFLSMACDTLEVLLQDIDTFAHPSEAITINSMCTVFAESEIISCLAMEKDRHKILTGVLQSIAQKMRQMIVKLDLDTNKPLLMTGGLSKSKLLMDIISKSSGFEVITHEYAQFAGAIGACVCAVGRYSR